MIKKIIIAITLCLPLMAYAQNDWEVPTSAQDSKANRQTAKAKKDYPYTKYLGPVVPEVNGEVVFEKTFTNNKSAEENYNLMLNFLTGMTKEEGQLDKSKISLVNKKDHAIICHFEEWMVFKSTILTLDRTRFIYTLVAESSDNKVKVKIFRISYWYNELQDGGEHFEAEEWITDKWALNKKKTRLAKISGKFRRLTVDRVEIIFDNIQTILNT